MLVSRPKRKVTVALLITNSERAQNRPETRQAATAFVGSEHGYATKQADFRHVHTEIKTADYHVD
jgi:hypothetical protein